MKTYGMILSLAVSGLIWAHDPPPARPQEQSPSSNGGWRRVGDPPPAPSNSNVPSDPSYSQDQPNNFNPQSYTAPPQLTIKPGTFLTVRINQPLSTDHNQEGDAFSATLVRPIVVDGIVVAQRGQILGGRVAEVHKAGRVQGVSRLGVQLTDLSLVDGQQIPIQAQLITRQGSTSVGRDAVAVGATTAAGAAIGAGVHEGVGAGVGAAAGLVVGTVGVLLTRGRPSVIYPESVLTFRIEAPVTISTERSAQAFRYVEPNEYDRPVEGRLQTRGPAGPPPAPYYYPAYYPRPYPYWGSGFGFYYGPSFFFGHGAGFYGHGFRH